MDFEEYIRQGEPSRAERAQAWRTAIGLQDVDGLKSISREASHFGKYGSALSPTMRAVQQGKTPVVMSGQRRLTQSLTESPNFSQNRHFP